MHKTTVCKVLNRFQIGKYLIAYVLKMSTMRYLMYMRIYEPAHRSGELIHSILHV